MKRIFDFLIATFAIVSLAPFLLILAMLIRINLGSPVLFKQKRVGLHGKIFKMYKFRSMTNEIGTNGELLSDQERLTSFGKKLRELSLDELPELWNILIGDMSFVGPRPLLVEYLDVYTDEEKHRHDVRPGLTGWAQINGRNLLTWKEKFALDLWYVNNYSYVLDVKIFLLTIGKVFSREGVSKEGHMTTEKYNGNN